MKINEKLGFIFEYIRFIRLLSIKYYTRQIKRMMAFFLINFHPVGELEASICHVIQGLQ